MFTSSLPRTRPSTAPFPPEASRPVATARLVTSDEGLAALQAPWQALWREDPQATVFQSPQWLLPWWRHVGAGRLFTIAVRDEAGGLVGLAPLYIYTDAASGRRHLFPLGIATSDYLGVLARPGWQACVHAAILRQLAGNSAAWDVLELPQLPRSSPLLSLQAPAGWKLDVSTGEPNPALALPAALPKSIAANLRTCRNRAARAGTLQYRSAGAADIAFFLAALVRLHALRWQQRGEPGVLRDDAVRAAHAQAAPLLHAAGMLRLHGLFLDGEPIAVLYCLWDPAPAHARRCCYYIGGFDPRHAGFSPGSLLLAHAIACAQAEGATRFDFLRGAEPYKYRWGALDQPMFTLRLWPR